MDTKDKEATQLVIARKTNRLLLENAHGKFLDKLEHVSHRDDYPFSYALCNDITNATWGLPGLGLSVSNDLSEAINQLHSWYNHLVDWEIWIEILLMFPEADQWQIRKKFVEPIAYFCTLQPSANRDRFGAISTYALHYANLATESSYTDRLDQDNKGYLTRKARELQIKRIGERWSKGKSFLDKLRAVDDEPYKVKTYNFRNLANHGIAPRFELGETSFIKRSLEEKTELIEQHDGSYKISSDPTQKVVCYGFGGTQPLSYSQAHSASLQQYGRAASLLKAYKELIRELLEALPKTPQGSLAR